MIKLPEQVNKAICLLKNSGFEAYAVGGAASQAMLSMDNELIRLAKEGRITRETAQLYAVNPDMLRKRL